MIFTGNYEHTIDAKNRLAIPSKYRSRLDSERDGDAFYVVPGKDPNTLWIYTERRFEDLAAQGESALIPDDDQLRFDQDFFPLAEYVDLDSQGRILLPERVLSQSGLGREVVICGVRDHMEVRARESFRMEAEEAWSRFRERQVKARDAYQQKRRQTDRQVGET